MCRLSGFCDEDQGEFSLAHTFKTRTRKLAREPSGNKKNTRRFASVLEHSGQFPVFIIVPGSLRPVYNQDSRLLFEMKTRSCSPLLFCRRPRKKEDNKRCRFLRRQKGLLAPRRLPDSPLQSLLVFFGPPDRKAAPDQIL